MSADQSAIERNLIEMLTLAGEYCIKIESADHYSKEDLFTFLQKIAPILYLQGLLFPEQEEPEEEGNERIVTEEQWENVFNTLRKIFESDDKFLYMDPLNSEDPAPVHGSLAEVYSDVYQDLKDFIWLMTKNSQMAKIHAAYNIKSLFKNNWGPKLLIAQYILHSRRITVSNDDYPEFDAF